MWGRALMLVLVTTVLTLHTHADQDEDNQLKIGRSVDIFTRYGYLAISMKVVGKNNSDWIFREPTNEVFKDADRYISHPERLSKKQKKIFEGDFHMEFCDNVKQLMQAYFRDFSFERLDNPWQAFTASWSPDILAKNLGINESYVIKEHCYVLMRLSRFREISKLDRSPNNLNLSEEVVLELENIKIGDVASVLTFIRKYGSHYIQSYVTGNSIYQVFVFNKTNYHQLRNRLKKQGITQISNLELAHYFSPWYSEHMGIIKVASGNRSVASWSAYKLRYNYSIFTYPSLLKIHGDPKLLTRLNAILGNEALLEMHMKSLASIIKHPMKRAWFEEVLDNFLKLWEVNL